MTRHPDPCASSGETSCALRAVEHAAACALNEAERVLTGAEDGCADIHQVCQMMALRCEFNVVNRALEAAQRAVMARINAGLPDCSEAA